MTLNRETPCEHGQMRNHLYGEHSGEEFPVGENMLRCTGFSCEEVNIDYEAAAFSLNHILESEGLTTHFDADDMEPIVDAALGVTEDVR